MSKIKALFSIVSPRREGGKQQNEETSEAFKNEGVNIEATAEMVDSESLCSDSANLPLVQYYSSRIPYSAMSYWSYGT